MEGDNISKIPEKEVTVSHEIITDKAFLLI